MKKSAGSGRSPSGSTRGGCKRHLLQLALIAAFATMAASAEAASNKATLRISLVVPPMCEVMQSAPERILSQPAANVDAQNAYTIGVDLRCNTPHRVLLHYDPTALPSSGSFRVRWGERDFKLHPAGVVELERVSGVYRGVREMRATAIGMSRARSEEVVKSMRLAVQLAQ